MHDKMESTCNLNAAIDLEKSDEKQPSFLSQSTYISLLHMSPELREQQYAKMGQPSNVKRKRVYFKSI